MIYVVEIPNQGRAHAWFAFDQDDFIRKVHASKDQNEWTIFTAMTPRQQLEMTGKTPDSPPAGEDAGIFARAEQHGWDTVLYRADYLLDPGVYQAEPVSEFDACIAAVAQDLQTCRIYGSDEAAMTALYQDPLYDGRDGLYPHIALRDQLIAMEVISDDL